MQSWAEPSPLVAAPPRSSSTGFQSSDMFKRAASSDIQVSASGGWKIKPERVSKDSVTILLPLVAKTGEHLDLLALQLQTPEQYNPPNHKSKPQNPNLGPETLKILHPRPQATNP